MHDLVPTCCDRYFTWLGTNRLSLISMPTYEFRCPDGHEFEKFYRSIGGAESQAACPVCGKPAERMMSAAGFAFKGSGFYLTDYGKNAHRGEAPPDAKSAAVTAGDAPADAPKGDAVKADAATPAGSDATKGDSAKSGAAAGAASDSKAASPKKAESAKPEAKATETKAPAAPKPGASE